MNIERVVLENEREEKRAESGEYLQMTLKLEGGSNSAPITVTFDELFNEE